MNPNINFSVDDLEKELILQMLKRFTLYEISVKFGIKYSDLIDHCIALRINQIELPENDRFSKANEICISKGFEGSLHYIRERGVEEFRRKIKPLIC